MEITKTYTYASTWKHVRLILNLQTANKDDDYPKLYTRFTNKQLIYKGDASLEFHTKDGSKYCQGYAHCYKEGCYELEFEDHSSITSKTQKVSMGYYSEWSQKYMLLELEPQLSQTTFIWSTGEPICEYYDAFLICEDQDEYYPNADRGSYKMTKDLQLCFPDTHGIGWNPHGIGESEVVLADK